MSNPSRPPRDLVKASATTYPDSFIPDNAAFDAARKTCKDLEVMRKRLAELDMEVLAAIELPKEFSVDPRVTHSMSKVLATAKTGLPSARVRSGTAKNFLSAGYAVLPDDGPLGKTECALKAANRFLIDGGCEMVVGRLAAAYPKKGSTVAAPVTPAEARAALVRCGLSLDRAPLHMIRKYPLVAPEGEDGVKVNPNSDNGFPVGGKWSDPAAQAKVLGLVAEVERQWEFKNGDVSKWLKEVSRSPQAWLVAFKGKCKGDYYSVEKLWDFKLRFYNAVPRHLQLLMQQATQPFEALSRSILQEGRSGIGMTLTHGGAALLVAKLEEQLDSWRTGTVKCACVHVGDDSWVCVKTSTHVCMFSLDCSNFDLTQHSATTLAVHQVLRDCLARFDKRAADLWYGLMRERVTVVAGSLVRLMKHGGPSGMMLQSKVNDMLMDVLLERLMVALSGRADLGRESLDKIVQGLGASMGFAVRLEEYAWVEAASIKEALLEHPFLFVGYRFHVVNSGVTVVCDLPRTLAQAQYPTMKWTHSKEDFDVQEAVRLSSIVLNMGIPPVEWEPAFTAWRNHALGLLEDVLQRPINAATKASLRWVVSENPVAFDAVPSVEGLLRVLQQPAETLWTDMEPEMPSTSVLVHDWADAVDEEEDELARAFTGRDVRASLDVLKARKALRVSVAPPRTHPVTVANDGRPPPTALWAPDRQPAPPRVELLGWTGARAPRRGGKGDRYRDLTAFANEGDDDPDVAEEMEEAYYRG